MWQSGGVLFLALEVSQNPVDNVLVHNTGDDLNRSIAMTANLDIEYSLESLSLGHGGMALSR